MIDPRDLAARDYTEFFSRHLIGLAWYEGPANEQGDFTEKPTFHCASAFLLQIEERFCLVTAGHVLLDIDKRLAENGHIAKYHNLYDIWSPRATIKEPIPFDFTKAESLIILFDPELGVDIAVIELSILYRELLAQTIQPFTHDRWLYQANVKFDFFAILGIPGEIASQIVDDTEQVIFTYPKPQVIFVEASKPVVAEDANTPLPQFFGKIRSNETIGDISGTSGGPILGFRLNDQGQLHYWPVAVQSRWRRESRTITGTSIPHFASKLHEWLESRRNKKNQDQE